MFELAQGNCVLLQYLCRLTKLYYDLKLEVESNTERYCVIKDLIIVHAINISLRELLIPSPVKIARIFETNGGGRVQHQSKYGILCPLCVMGIATYA